MTFDLNRKSQFKMKRLMIESAIDKALKDIETNPFRGTRNLVDTGLHFSASRFQKNLFEIIHDILNNEESPYYELVSRTVLNTDKNKLKQFGANIGYNSWTYGASLIREQERLKGIHTPWTILYDFPKKMIRWDFKLISDYISEGEKTGIYTSMLFPESFDSQYEEILDLLSKHKDSGFIIFEKLQNISDSSLKKLAGLNNVMIVPMLKEKDFEKNHEIFNKIQSKKILYSIGIFYNDKNYLEITKDGFMSTLEKFKSPLLFFIPDRKNNCSIKTKKHIQQLKSAYRSAIKYSYFTIDLFNDMDEINHIISGNASFLELFGTSYYKTSPFSKEKFPISDETKLEKIIFR